MNSSLLPPARPSFFSPLTAPASASILSSPSPSCLDLQLPLHLNYYNWWTALSTTLRGTWQDADSLRTHFFLAGFINRHRFDVTWNEYFFFFLMVQRDIHFCSSWKEVGQISRSNVFALYKKKKSFRHSLLSRPDFIPTVSPIEESAGEWEQR